MDQVQIPHTMALITTDKELIHHTMALIIKDQAIPHHTMALNTRDHIIKDLAITHNTTALITKVLVIMDLTTKVQDIKDHIFTAHLIMDLIIRDRDLKIIHHNILIQISTAVITTNISMQDMDTVNLAIILTVDALDVSGIELQIDLNV